MVGENDDTAESTGQDVVARELRSQRERAGLSRTELARRVGYSRTYISTSEKPGADLISKAVVARIDHELGAQGALIAVHTKADAERRARRSRTDADPVESPAAGPAGTEFPTGLPAPELRRAARPGAHSERGIWLSGDRLADLVIDESADVSSPAVTDVMGTELGELASAMQPTGVTAAILDHTEQTVHRIHARFATLPPAEMLPVVNGHLRATSRLLRLGQPGRYRKRLCSIAGHLAGQRAWLMFDLGLVDEAEAWYRLALEPALEAGHDALVAWLLGGHSVAVFDRGDIRGALSFLTRSHEYAKRAGTAPVAGWQAGLEARAHAALGDTGETHAAIARAEAGTCPVAEDTYRHGMDIQDSHLNVAYYRGCSLLALGDVVAARRAFEEALVAQGSGHLKGSAVVMLQIASTYVQQDAEHAVDLAVSAWTIPPEQRIGPIVERICRLREEVSHIDAGRHADRLNRLLAMPPTPRHLS